MPPAAANGPFGRVERITKQFSHVKVLNVRIHADYVRSIPFGPAGHKACAPNNLLFPRGALSEAEVLRDDTGEPGDLTPSVGEHIVAKAHAVEVLPDVFGEKPLD